MSWLRAPSHRLRADALLAACALATACTGRGTIGDSDEQSAESLDAPSSGPVSGEQGESTGGVTGSSSGESEVGEASEAESGAWLPGDQGGVCDVVCDPWTPFDCGEGLKCVPVVCATGSNSWDTNVCVVILGDQQVGEPCISPNQPLDGQDDCREGAICWGFTGPDARDECIALCGGSASAPECALGSHCVIPGDGIPAICLPDCDPLAQDCQNTGDLCLPTLDSSGFLCVLNASGDVAPRGTPCNFLNSCNQGLMCAALGRVEAPGCDAQGCCTPMCDTTASNVCEGATEQCVSLDVPGSSVGACVIPEAP